MRQRWVFASIATAGLWVYGCSSATNVYIGECDPNAPFPDPHCRTPDDSADAGSDAADGADDDTESFRPDADTCSGICVPEPSSASAGIWPSTPMLLWVGPRAIAPASCDEARIAAGLPEDVVFFEKYRRFADLIAPPAECEPCVCPVSEGQCSGLPATIEVRAGKCAEPGASSLPFGGPAGWDGSCTNANALPAGAQCNGEPCAQSIEASPLPGPTTESCPTVTAPPPAFKLSRDWGTAGLACAAKELPGACAPSTFRCMYDAPHPWRQCVALSGIHETCPGNYTNERFVLYGEAPKDARGCTSCECGGTPVGSACVAKLRLFQDSACAQEIASNGLSSYGKQCSDVQPPGRALGSKAITDLAYYPGVCLATGGEPTGAAEQDAEEAVTFCCRAPLELPPLK